MLELVPLLSVMRSVTAAGSRLSVSAGTEVPGLSNTIFAPTRSWPSTSSWARTVSNASIGTVTATALRLSLPTVPVPEDCEAMLSAWFKSLEHD